MGGGAVRVLATMLLFPVFMFSDVDVLILFTTASANQVVTRVNMVLHVWLSDRPTKPRFAWKCDVDRLKKTLFSKVE